MLGSARFSSSWLVKRGADEESRTPMGGGRADEETPVATSRLRQPLPSSPSPQGRAASRDPPAGGGVPCAPLVGDDRSFFRNKHGLSWASVLVGLGLRRFVYWAASVNLAETWIFFIFLYLPFYKFTKIYTPRDILQNYKYTVVRNRTVVSTRVVGRVPGHIYV
jgi:hypothetical protein